MCHSISFHFVSLCCLTLSLPALFAQHSTAQNVALPLSPSAYARTLHTLSLSLCIASFGEPKTNAGCSCDIVACLQYLLRVLVSARQAISSYLAFVVHATVALQLRRLPQNVETCNKRSSLVFVRRSLCQQRVAPQKYQICYPRIVEFVVVSFFAVRATR